MVEKKEITIVHRGRLPLNDNYPDSFRKQVQEKWKKRGVEFILEDEIDRENYRTKRGVITTKKGKAIAADIAVCFS